MPQTLLALFALVCATYYTSTRQRVIVDDQVRLIYNEVELIGASVAVDRLEEISSKEFDQATIGSPTLTAASQLTATASFGKEAGDNNDIDDFQNGVDTLLRKAGTATLRFRVQTTVAYGAETSPETVSTASTKVKTVTATVRSLDVVVPSSVTLKRSFTCGSDCAW